MPTTPLSPLSPTSAAPVKTDWLDGGVSDLMSRRGSQAGRYGAMNLAVQGSRPTPPRLNLPDPIAPGAPRSGPAPGYEAPPTPTPTQAFLSQAAVGSNSAVYGLGQAQTGLGLATVAPGVARQVGQRLPTLTKPLRSGAALLGRVPGVAAAASRIAPAAGKLLPALGRITNPLLGAQYALEAGAHTANLQNDDALSNAIATDSVQAGPQPSPGQDRASVLRRMVPSGQNLSDNWDAIRPFWLPGQNGFDKEDGLWFDPTYVGGELADSTIRATQGLSEIPRGAELDRGLTQQAARHADDTQQAMQTGSAGRGQLIDHMARARAERAASQPSAWNPIYWGMGK